MQINYRIISVNAEEYEKCENKFSERHTINAIIIVILLLLLSLQKRLLMAAKKPKQELSNCQRKSSFDRNLLLNQSVLYCTNILCAAVSTCVQLRAAASSSTLVACRRSPLFQVEGCFHRCS